MESTNFKFFRNRWPAIADDAASAERDAHENPRAALRNLRSICEEVLRSVFSSEQTLKPILNRHRAELPADLHPRLDDLKEAADDAVHPKPGRQSDRISPETALRHLKTTFDLLVWASGKLGDVPPSADYVEPPRGGHEWHETQKLLGNRPQDLSGWIDTSAEGGIESAADDRYIGRSALIREIHARLSSGQQRILIAGEPGRGKTRLLKELSARGILAEFGQTFTYFFVSTAGRGPDSLAWLRHFYASFLERFDLEETSEAIHRMNNDDLQNRLCARLSEFCGSGETRRLIFVIDAIDEAGDAEPAVVDFLCRRLPALPPQVTVLATLRPGHLPSGMSADINLEESDRLNEHRTDGRRYVSHRLNGLKIPQNLIDEIAQVGDGNFRALFHICQEIRRLSSHREIREYLDRLRSNPDVLTGVYEEWWRRLEHQVEADDLEKLVRMAALIAATLGGAAS